MTALRRSRPSDAAALGTLHAQHEGRGWSSQEFAALLSMRGVDGLIAEDAHGHMLAFTLMRRLGPDAEVLALLVDAAMRRQGIAAMLLARGIALLRQEGCESLFLEVAEDNDAALALYRRFGFVQIGRRPGYYPRDGGMAVAARNLRLDLQPPDHPISSARMDSLRQPS